MNPAASAPTLVVVRGNSGSGKTSLAREVRDRYGRGCALIEQDYLRRVVLREHGSSRMPAVAPGFITTMARTALHAGYHVVLEGILHTGQYQAPLHDLIAEHSGRSFVFWLQVSFEETLRRHAGRPELAHVTAELMRSWYTPMDLLDVAGEQVIDESSTLDDSVAAILECSGLTRAAPLTPCPLECAACARELQDDSAPPSAGHHLVGGGPS